MSLWLVEGVKDFDQKLDEEQRSICSSEWSVVLMLVAPLPTSAWAVEAPAECVPFQFLSPSL